MSASRIGEASARGPIRIFLDGNPLEAREGEPVAVSLVAAGVEVLARSVKFHRPRGPFCFAGRCEGCLARVDGVPNLATCRVPARDGMRVERQNAFPSADSDLLRTIDWFFPKGMDHHEFMAWLPEPLHTAMRATARRMSGLGLLPEGDPPPTPTFERIDTDVAIVGAGPAGLAAAEAAAKAGARTIALDENDEAGGHLRQSPDDALSRTADASAAAARAAGAQIRGATRALAYYDGDKLVAANDTGLVEISARAVILATGTHPQPMLYEGNDLPGTVSARAAVALVRRWQVLPGRAPAVVGDPRLAAPVADLLEAAGASVVRAWGGEIVRARGRKSVRGIVHRADGREVSRACDAIVVATAGAPAFELAVQAGCPVRFDPASGFVVTSGAGKTLVAGELAGHEGDGIEASGTAAGREAAARRAA